MPPLTPFLYTVAVVVILLWGGRDGSELANAISVALLIVSLWLHQRSNAATL